MQFSAITLVATAMVALVASSPITPDAQRKTDANSISNLLCTNKTATLPEHDVNVALLKICGGIAGKIQKCQGSPPATIGEFGKALFALNPTTAGATINISKGRWEQCIRAAKLECGATPFTATCKGGASKGDVDFSLFEI